MKKLLLPLMCVLFSGTTIEAAEIDYDLKKPTLYHVEVKDSQHKVLFSTSTNNLTNKMYSKSLENTFIDNCIKDKGIVEFTKSSIPTNFSVAFGEDSGLASSLIINVSMLVDKKIVNTGECNIEEAIVGSATITQNLPFLSFEYKFQLKDKSGHQLPEIYYLTVSGSKLKQ